ncbi:hypothetical protein DV735_g4252, partial [Chaetothyriales sp. CBS 134920]
MASGALYRKARTGAALLSLDGGGVKGISSLMILQRIMDRVREIENKERSFTDAAERLPRDYFDLAGGTSTGGLAALMMFRLGMSTSQTIDQYKTLASKVFAPTIAGFEIHKLPLGYSLGNLWLWAKRLIKGASFSADRLEDAIDTVLQLPELGPFRGSGSDLLYDPTKPSGMMLMCATVAEKGETVLFRSYKLPDDSQPQSETAKKIDHSKITIKQACRATSAAPTYLPEMWIGDISFWDGGLLNNNPVDQVWDARYDLPHARRHCVVSIGTSYFPEAISKQTSSNHDNDSTSSSGGIANLIQTAIRTVTFATNTEAKHWDFMGNNIRRNARLPAAAAAAGAGHDHHTRYFRYNARASKQVNLDDYQSMHVLVRDTDTYLAYFDRNLNADGKPMNAAELDMHINECARQLAKTVPLEE